MNGHQTLGYVRVSTDKQADAGLSLDVQQRKIRAMAEVQDVALTDVLIDAGESAKSLQRPAMARLLALVDAGAVDTLIVAKLDRLTRSVRDFWALIERFDRRKVSLVSVAEKLDTGSAMGRFMLTVMVAGSQLERELTGERTLDIMRHKRANGERVGTLPFGAQLAADGEHLEPNPVEQDRLARIRDLKATGRTLKQIAEDLNAAGSTTRRGTPWRFQYVARALRCGGAR